MFDRPRIVGLVTARGGSKRLPRKNVLPFAGRPLVAWSVGAALASRYLDRVIISTDDVDIAEAARDAGGEVPFLRPTHLASDTATQIDVIMHFLEWMKAEEGGLPDYILLLQPTSPLRNSDDIDGIIESCEHTGAESIASVALAPAHPLLMYQLDDSGHLTRLLPTDDPLRRTQDMPPVYVLNGALYLFTPAFVFREGSVVNAKTLAYFMPKERSLDIDDHFDFALAEGLVISANRSCRDA